MSITAAKGSGLNSGSMPAQILYSLFGPCHDAVGNRFVDVSLHLHAAGARLP
jgi:hypothetical protein